MCLIAYSPNGELMARDVFDSARAENADGIGIMSKYAVEKYTGRKAGRRAWALIERLAHERIPYAVHFRWRTHGPITSELCHPFKSPDGNTFVMHNGVISETGAIALPHESDTSVFVREFVDFRYCLTAESRKVECESLEELIGWGNKLCMLDMAAGTFTLCNEDMGEWLEGFWYSQTYSLPDRLCPRRQHWLMALNREESNITAVDSLRWPSWEDERDAQLASTVNRLERSARGTLRLVHSKEEAPHIDSERSYYRAAMQDAGYYDTGHEPAPRAYEWSGQVDEDEYRAMLKEAAIAGMSH